MKHLFLPAATLPLIMVSAAIAQTNPLPPAASPSPATSEPTVTGPRATLVRMQRTVSLDVKDRRLEDVVRFIQEITQADLEPLWANDQGIGLDKEMLISVKVQNRPALTLLEAVLEKARTDAIQSNAWQMTSEGTMQFGPKELLNRTRRLVIYDINDLLLVIPSYPDVPQIDLNSVLQQGQGGSGQSPFTGAQNQQNLTPQQVEANRETRALKIQELITTNVEPDQWVDNGGDAATIRFWNGTFLVNAPDYIHRQIAGYPYWPNSTTRVVGGRRYVTLNMDTGTATVDGFAQSEVTAVVGGQPVPSGGKKGGNGGEP